MSTTQIITQVAVEIEPLFSKLRLGKSIYTTAVIEPLPSMGNLEIQVACGEITYPEWQGGVRPANFAIHIGIFLKSGFDYTTHKSKAIEDIRTGIFTAKETIITSLDGTFLSTLLTRPLRIAHESGVRVDRSSNSKNGLYWKELSFVGGTNALRSR